MARSPTEVRGAAAVLGTALLVVSVVFAALAPIAVVLHVGCDRGLTHTVGVFVVLAELLRDGVFYPAEPSSSLVYATFYHPLAFAPLAVLPGEGLDLARSMRVLVGIELCACLAVVWALARCGGVAKWCAWQPALWALATVPVSFGLLGMRDDPRAALLGLLAVWLYLRGGRRAELWAGGVLTLAFFAKATAPAAPGLALCWLAWQRGGAGATLRFIAACAAPTLLIAALLQWAVGADFLGNGLRWIVDSARPSRGLGETLAALAGDLITGRALPLLLLASIVALIAAAKQRRAGIWGVLLAATWLKTLIAYRSVGTDLNHLLDLALCASLQLAVHARSLLESAGRGAALAFLAAMLAVGLPHPFDLLLDRDGAKPLADSELARGAEFLRQGPPQLTLCEEPLLAWLADQQPLLTDPLLTFAALRDHPAIRDRWFAAKTATGALQRIVLMRDPRTPEGQHWYRDIHFDAAFLTELERNWQIVAAGPRFTVALRK